MAAAAQLPELFLDRLRRLATIRNQRRDEFNREGLAMIDRSIFSTYLDCQKHGKREEAMAILGTGHSLPL